MDDELEATELNDCESFSFLFSSLWEADSAATGHRRVVVNIPDTIMYKDGTPNRWLFTSEQTGEVMKKKGDKLIPSDIVRSFKAKSRGLKGFKDIDSRSKIATVWYMTSKATMASYLVDDEQLASILHEEFVLEILAIQVFMGGWPIKASGIFEHRYWVRKNGTVGSETFELACVANGQNISTFSHNLDRLLIGEAHHEACANYAKRTIKRLELIARSKIANIVLQIVFNSSNFPFLVGIRGVFLWYPSSHFLENRCKLCFAASRYPEIPTNRSAILPRIRETPLLRGNSSVGFDLGGAKSAPNFTLPATIAETEPASVHFQDGNNDGGGWEMDDNDDDNEEVRERRAAERAATSEARRLSQAAKLAQQAQVRASIDSEEPILPHYAPMPGRRGVSNVQYGDQDLPFRSSKLELGRLNGAGRRPLSASATGVYFPTTGTAQMVQEAAVVTAAVGKSRRASNLLASVDEEKNGRSALEFVRRPAPSAGERRHCEQMTESHKTRLQYYQSQLREAETLPIDKFLKLRHPIGAPHGKTKKDLAVSARGINVALGGHGTAQGGRRSTGFERKLPTQSGTVCFGDYCLLAYEQLGEDREEHHHSHDAPAQTIALQSRSHESALQQLGVQEHHTNTEHAAAAASSLPLIKTAAASVEAKTEVYRRPEMLPHQLPFRSVLLARSEESYNGTKLWEDNALDLEVGELEPKAIPSGSEGLTQLAKRHLQRVGKSCLTLVRRSVHHCDAESYQAAWDSLNKEYRNQIYADALSKVHPSRFYFTVPLCDQCWKLYSLLDFYRERIVFGALQAELEHNARKRMGSKKGRRPQSSPMRRGNYGGPSSSLDESFDRQMGRGDDMGSAVVFTDGEGYEEEKSVEGLRGGGGSIGINISGGGAATSWVKMLSEGEGDGYGQTLPPRPTTSGRPKSDRGEVGHVETKENTRSRSASPGPRVPKQFSERLALGIAPLQQTRQQAAPLGNMLSATAGNHGGRVDKKNIRENSAQLSQHGASRRKATAARPKSAAVIGGGGKSSSRHGGIYRGEMPGEAEVREFDGDSLYLPPFGPGNQQGAYGFSSIERSHFRPHSTMGADVGGAPEPFPGPGPAPVFPINNLMDITKTQPLDLLDAQYQYTSSGLPYTSAPFFPLPSSLASASIELFEFDQTMRRDMYQDIDGTQSFEILPQENELDFFHQLSLESSGSGRNMGKGGAVGRKQTADPKKGTDNGHFIQVMLQDKIKGFEKTYGASKAKVSPGLKKS